MEKYLILALCAGVISLTSTAIASDTVQTYLFPAKYIVNGQTKTLDNEYTTLNYNGHAHVPVRFISESIGATIPYEDSTNSIFVKSGFTDEIHSNLNGVSMGNLILTKNNVNTKVTGQIKIEGMTKAHIGANPAFFNDNGDKIGFIVINGDYVEGRI